MIKIITDEDLVGMSQYLTPDCQDEPCSNCLDVKAAIKRGDIKQFRLITHWPEDEAEEAILSCHRCLWYWVDDVVSVEPNDPLTLEQLREMDGEHPECGSRAAQLRRASEEEMAELLAKGCCNMNSECVDGMSCFDCWQGWLRGEERDDEQQSYPDRLDAR